MLDADEALRLSGAVLVSDADDGEAYRIRRRAKAALGDFRGAVADCDASLELDARDAVGLKIRADPRCSRTAIHHQN